ncbi:MFS transporter [Flavobacterium hydrophilum]|uniref:MFS transporter n=1 Tax=Flavobacterium hydrophilum TaxID=2211445 RepID=A0A2V4C537_9FLAO|nr:MFS transporter [Flavobacterium hydrophilum]PXY46451.1 MFS transporter [Flavobacterium hydrophilum]
MKKNQLQNVFPVLFGFFIMGFCDVVGITATHVKADFGLSDTMSNMIPVALFSMFLLFSVPTGILMNKIGRKRTVLISNIITIVAMFLPLIGYTFALCIVSFALLGIANTMLQVSINPLLSNIVQGDKLSSTITAGQFVKAISSFCGPFIAAYTASELGNWQYIFPIYAVITLISTIWLTATPIQEEQIVADDKGSFINVFSLLKDKTILQLFFGIVFLVGIDVGVNTAAPKILMERCGLDSISAGYGTSMYFAFRTTGSFIGVWLLSRFSSKAFFKITAVITVLALLALIFIANEAAIFALYGLIGLSIANVFSILFSIALQSKPEKANEISGLMVTGVFGGAVVPFVMGLATDTFGSQIGSVVIILVCAFYLLYCSFAVRAESGTEEN